MFLALYIIHLSLVQFSSVAQSCPTLCDPMNRSTPGLSVHHHLPEFTQPHIHQVCDAIQPSHPQSSPSLPTPNPSQHQSLFQWILPMFHQLVLCFLFSNLFKFTESYNSFLVDKLRYNPNKNYSFFSLSFHESNLKRRKLSFPASVSRNICDRMQYSGNI